MHLSRHFCISILALFPNPFVVPKATWNLIVKFWYLNLSETDTIMLDYYPKSGKAATRLPSVCSIPICYPLSYTLHPLQNGVNFLKFSLYIPFSAGFRSVILPMSEPSMTFSTGFGSLKTTTTPASLNTKNKKRQNIVENA